MTPHFSAFVFIVCIKNHDMRNIVFISLTTDFNEPVCSFTEGSDDEMKQAVSVLDEEARESAGIQGRRM